MSPASSRDALADAILALAGHQYPPSLLSVSVQPWKQVRFGKLCFALAGISHFS